MATRWWKEKPLPRKAEYGANNERLELHPKARNLIHRAARTQIGMIGPLIVGGGVVLTTALHFIPQERSISDRIKKLMDSTLDEIDILEKQKLELAQQLDQLNAKINANKD
eukprot:488200_1